MLTVTIAVLTFRRTDRLRTLLPLLEAQRLEVAGPETTVDILVVDNDAARSAEPAVREFSAQRYVRYVCEPLPGIANARNRALDEASTTRLLAFIDDDESPQTGWLRALVETWQRTEPAAVAGRVVEYFSVAPDQWIVAGGFFRRRSLPTGTPVERAGAGNLLLDLDYVRRAGVRFDGSLGFAGGEDTLFCAQLRQQGGVIVWCQEAQALDHIPAERLSRRWVLARAFSHGNAAGRVDLRMVDRPAARARIRVHLLGRGCARLAGGLLRGALGTVSRRVDHEARGLRTASRGLGMTAAAAGWRHQEYRRPAPARRRP